MTMVEQAKKNWKELHCAQCDKFMGFINENHQHFPKDFFCSLKCINDNETQQKTKEKITQQTMKK